ncbi:ComF family protein [Corynebacterium macclintockiae]|nr:ComF family protein [Corynebacterium macclintockiae]
MGIRGDLEALAGLVWRADCVCCGQLNAQPAGGVVGRQLCAECGVQLLQPWQRWQPRVATVPVFAAGTYGGARRMLILSAKDRLRPAAITVAGRVLAAGILHVAGLGLVPDPRFGRVALLPAPTRKSAARRRGGDIVTRMCHAAAELYSGIEVHPVAWLDERSVDSVGLDRHQRRENVAGSILFDTAAIARLRGAEEAVIVDDVCTTGATTAQFALALSARGVRAKLALVIAGA